MWGYCLGALGVAAAVAYTFQDYLLYYPTIQNSRTEFIKPTGNLLNAFEEHFITTEDGVSLNLWLFRRSSSRPTILFFHGNAGNISHRLPNLYLLFDSLNCNVAILEYRGFGKSSGWPYQKGIQIDAKCALRWLQSSEGTPNCPIILFGRSLGGAVAIHLAAEMQDEVAAIIVENTFTSVLDMIDVLMGYLSWAKILVRNPWKSIDVVDKITIPFLFISSSQDELVPAVMMKSLFDKSKSPHKEFVEYPTHHMDAWMHPTYFPKLQDWLHKHDF